MSRYLKLVNFELNRFFKIYLGLIAFTAISQIIGVINRSSQYMNQANEAIYERGMALDEFIQQYGPMSFQKVSQSLFFQGPIGICIAMLLIYMFFIWYRDWFGKNTFIYRLLMLPTERINIYMAKATTILLLVFGLISVQILLLPLESTVLQWMVPEELRMDMSVNEIIGADVFGLLSILYPVTVIEFFISYAIGIMAVFVAFTCVLLERSFRWKGIGIGLVYALGSIVIFFLPMLIEEMFFPYFLYPMELLLLMLLTGLIVTALAIWIGHYLLKNKIRV
ncbi:hypothetical protein [Ornithinibacillus halophilus]|uniref:ABC-2 family transporter protein n=1 Tax=Ornithinibacillus halophilus TaxID=930117 RepID=A0A1M5KNN8_9BACI|nr:hypothetical protein [Ornithinibacillus halophilus]SHG54424.1 hypothetical protein SAMN05216225_10408 [Ornithinibacillus halophilus]